MQDIERILNEAGVKPTAIRMIVMKEIIAIYFHSLGYGDQA